ncbi:hypothetical protein AOQ84DRAFT_369293 [Glonium stellatum]|uniref:Uncharacterized protein n=1 Tax=Glonium stellatum TaxID=574774 RepID=A0A8E2EP77_9PEZI|nr:hypothetical protein AOQ84DRAFT_369293 [Glonium stellatum]
MPPTPKTLCTSIVTADPDMRPTIRGTWYPSCLNTNVFKDLVLHFHGNGYTIEDARTSGCGFGASIALKHASVGYVFCPHYQLSQFPAALQDALTYYDYLIFNLATPPSKIIH